MPTIRDMDIAAKLGNYLEREDRNAAWLASSAGLSTAAISRYLSGVRRPGVEEMVALARATGLSLEYLCDDSIEHPPAPIVPPDMVAFIKRIGVDDAWDRLARPIEKQAEKEVRSTTAPSFDEQNPPAGPRSRVKIGG